MNIFKKAYCRTYQTFMKLAIPLMPYREPEIVKTVNIIPKILKDHNLSKPLLVTDKSIRGLGLTNELETSLKNSKIDYAVYDGTVPNPTITNIEESLKTYLGNGCDSIIAFGGGSVMDCAKVTGARVVKPNQPVNKMKGLLKVRKKLPLLIAIPTTAGTGSETTVAAVITDDKTHYKYAINDFSLIPDYAVLDYKNTLGLPPHITSSTGMDALTHAVEAYIGNSTTKRTRELSEKAVRLIVKNLPKVYKDGSNATARENMLVASYYAGVAFTISYVGYVHAVAHSLGGKYGVPHGFANAVILPHFLDSYRPKIDKKLAKLAVIAGLSKETDDIKQSADTFVNWIREQNKIMNIPTYIEALKEEDIPNLAKKANAEGNPLYPVPVLMNTHELEEMYRKLLK